MVSNSSVKNLVKILIGSAWIDGIIQPEERQYLKELAKEKGVADDPEIKPFLYELVPVKVSDCYAWVREYLGDSPTTEDCQNLIQSISGLIYSDGEVAVEEGKLLTRLQNLSNESDSNHSTINVILKQIQKLYKRCVEVQS